MADNSPENREDRVNLAFWRRLWQILQPFHRRMGFLLLLVVITQVFKIISPYIFKLVIDQFSVFDAAKINYLFLLIGLMFAADAFSSLIYSFKDKKIFKMLAQLERFFPLLLHQKLISLSLGYHEKENTGNKVMKVQRGVDIMVW